MKALEKKVKSHLSQHAHVVLTGAARVTCHRNSPLRELLCGCIVVYGAIIVVNNKCSICFLFY